MGAEAGRPLSLDVSETGDEVRVDNVSGEFIDGDCLGSVALTLEQPLGTRTLVVEGNHGTTLATTARSVSSVRVM